MASWLTAAKSVLGRKFPGQVDISVTFKHVIPSIQSRQVLPDFPLRPLPTSLSSSRRRAADHRLAPATSEYQYWRISFPKNIEFGSRFLELESSDLRSVILARAEVAAEKPRGWRSWSVCNGSNRSTARTSAAHNRHGCGCEPPTAISISF